MLNTVKAFRLIKSQGVIEGPPLAPGQTIPLGFLFRAPAGIHVGRFNVVAEDDTTVIGGNTYVITARP